MAHYLNFFLQIRMLVRLIPAHGGDGTIHGIIAMNDTGSDMLTLFNTDLDALGNMQGYSGWQLPSAVLDANGTITVFRTIVVQVRLARGDNTPWVLREAWRVAPSQEHVTWLRVIRALADLIHGSRGSG